MMFEITVKRNGINYKYFCMDEESVCYLFRRLKDVYEESEALTENVTMEIREGEYWYMVEKGGYVLRSRDMETVNVVVDRGLP